MKRFLVILATVALGSAFGGCDRDQYPGERKGAIERERLPTPRKDSKVADALGSATPVPAHPSAPPAKAEKPTEKPVAVVKAKPTEEAPPPVVKEAPATPKEAPAATAAFSLRSGSVGKGVDLRDAPSSDAEVLGTFQGKTKIQVVAEQGEFSRVKAPTTGGSSVEGWVLTSAVKAPEAAKVAKVEPAAPKTDAKPASTDAKAAPKAEKPAAAPKAAPVKAGAKGNGPDDISLKAIAGMKMKRAAVPFTHKKHYDDYSVKCADCHHPVKAKGGAVPATKTCTDAGCHLAAECNGQAVAAKNKACPNFEDAYHYNCIECHRAQSGPTKCAECHTG